MNKKLLLLLLLLLAVGLPTTTAAPSTNKVLILSSTISNGLAVPGGSYEAAAVLAAGLVPEIVSPSQWSSMTAFQFGTYRAIVLGDASCTSIGAYAAPQANAATWLPQVTGNIVVMGTDPVYHVRGSSGINQWNLNAIAFAVADPTKVGAYICLSCAYDSVPINTPIPMLAPLGAFTARGVNCFNNAHIVAVHAALNGLTDSILSNWGCSVHNGFDSFPPAFSTLAIARSVGGSGTLTFADGSVGVPYILARGVIPVLCGDGILQLPEQCDNGTLNGMPGSLCSSDCRLHWCGDGQVDPAEACDMGVANGEAGASCSSSCTITGPVCAPAGCGTHGRCLFLPDGLHTRCACDSTWSGPDCMCNVPSYLLSTDHPPKLDVMRSGFLVKDKLTLMVNVSSKYYDVHIEFKNERNITCDFPATTAVNHWSTFYYGPSQCELSIVGTLPWTQATQCLFLREETSNYITFSGEMEVSMTEDLPSIRDIPLSRTHLHTLPFQIVFPKRVTVTSDSLTVYSTHDVKAAIVDQSYISTLPPAGTGTVRLYTSVQWPYVLQPAIGASSDNILLPITVTGPEIPPGSAECPNGSGSICQQHFDFSIIPGPGQCNLNGRYRFDFMIGCQPGIPANQCPLLSPSSGTIFYTLESSYICQQVVANVDLTATLEPYPTSAYDTAKYDFMLGLTGFYLIETKSTQVSISQTVISQVTALAPNGTTILLYQLSSGGNTNAGNWVSLIVSNGYAGRGKPNRMSTFSLVYVPSFFNIPVDSLAHWSFSVVANVVFLNTGPLALSPITLALVPESSQKSPNNGLADLFKFVLSSSSSSSLLSDDRAGRDLQASAGVVVVYSHTSEHEGHGDSVSPASTHVPTAKAAIYTALSILLLILF